MKKLLTITAILALAGAAWAKAPAKEATKGAPENDAPAVHGDHEGAPGKMGDGKEEGPKGMKEELGLSEEQASKLRGLREGQRDEMKKMRRKMRDLMAKLEDQVDDKASDSALNATMKELNAAKKDMESSREKMEKASDALLTTLQRAKMALKRGRGGMGPGMGMGMGMGPGMGMGGPGMMGGKGGPEGEGPDDKGGPEGKEDGHDAGKGRGHYND